MDFAVPADNRTKLNVSEKKDKYLDLARKLKKMWNMKVTIILIVIGTLCTRIEKRTGGLGNKWTSGDYPKYCINEISQNIEKSTGDLRRHPVFQAAVKDHQLTVTWKTLK